MELPVNVRRRNREMSIIGAGATVSTATNATKRMAVEKKQATTPLCAQTPNEELVVVLTRPATRIAIAAVRARAPSQSGRCGAGLLSELRPS